jgi:hypothetical protein
MKVKTSIKAVNGKMIDLNNDFLLKLDWALAWSTIVIVKTF